MSVELTNWIMRGVIILGICGGLLFAFLVYAMILHARDEYSDEDDLYQ